MPNITYSKRANWTTKLTFALGACNFFALMVSSAYLHGDALNGYARAGHYFVCAKGGICTEVSKFAWHASYWHAWSVFAFVVLLLAEVVYFRSTDDIKRQ
jgi:hypothetical protein